MDPSKVEITPNEGKNTIAATDPSLQPASNESPESSKSASPDDTTISEDPNWKAFREARKRDRAEKEAAERLAAAKAAEAEALKAAMEAAFAKQSPHQPQNDYSYDAESEDEKIEKKVSAILETRERARLREVQEREAREFPNRLVGQYPDFNQVVNQETLDYLEYHYPEVVRPLKRLPDGFDKWEDVYLTIKKLMPNVKNSKQDLAKAELNASKPRSPSAAGVAQSGASASQILSEDRKRANWERMQKAMRGG